jgi:DNA-binding LytR/AlgR family response regulator
MIVNIQANLSVLEGKLADDIFMRIHRSYLIKLSQIDAIDFVKCELRICESWLPFSRTKKQELKDLVESRKLEM